MKNNLVMLKKEDKIERTIFVGDLFYSTCSLESKKNTMATFYVSQRNDDQWQFQLKSDEGGTLLQSEGYTTKAACMNGVESVKENSTSEGRYDKQENKGGKWYFNLKASNGQIIGTSPAFSDEAACDLAIAVVTDQAGDAPVNE